MCVCVCVCERERVSERERERERASESERERERVVRLHVEGCGGLLLNICDYKYQRCGATYLPM